MRPHSRTVAPGLLALGNLMAPSEPTVALGMTATETMSLAINLTEAFRDLVQIGIALTSERDLATLLHRILTEARRFTRAEAGTLFLRENDELHFAVVQNDRLARRLGDPEMQRLLQSEPLKLSEPSLAGHVALMGEIVNLPDTYATWPAKLGSESFRDRKSTRLNSSH